MKKAGDVHGRLERAGIPLVSVRQNGANFEIVFAEEATPQQRSTGQSLLDAMLLEPDIPELDVMTFATRLLTVLHNSNLNAQTRAAVDALAAEFGISVTVNGNGGGR